MRYIPDVKMRINAYKAVAIPRPLDYMKRFGMSVAPSNLYSGDELAPLPSSKVDQLAQMEAYDAMMQREEAKNKNE